MSFQELFTFWMQCFKSIIDFAVQVSVGGVSVCLLIIAIILVRVVITKLSA